DGIVQDLFDVTHPRGLQLRVAPLDDAVRYAVQCLEALIDQLGVTLELELAKDTPPAPHDADQLQQVLINLVKNAAEASAPGGKIAVSVGPWRARGHLLGAEISVRDQGPGIAPEHLRTMFEPFFTTKPGGSGLGLYISHDIVKRHGGSLSVSSEPGPGTTSTGDLHRTQPEVPVIMMTAFGELETAVEAMSAGAYWFVKKPFQNEELVALVHRALESQKMWIELRRLRHRAFADEDFLHSSSPSMQ